MESWIFPRDPLLEDRQLELDQRKRPPHSRENVAKPYSHENATFATFPQQSSGRKVAFMRQSSGNSRGSRTRVPSIRASQAIAAYKYLINSPERGLERKQRAEHLYYLSYSYYSSLASLQFSLGFYFRN